MIQTNGKKCLKFTIDRSQTANEPFETLFYFRKEFDKDIIFHRSLMVDDQILISFLFKDGNDDRLVKFLWDTVLYFKNGSYPSIEKVEFVLDGTEINLHPIGTAVS